jgi:hypothetical protein
MNEALRHPLILLVRDDATTTLCILPPPKFTGPVATRVIKLNGSGSNNNHKPNDTVRYEVGGVLVLVLSYLGFQGFGVCDMTV